jgi:hypothetical protein
MTFWNMVDAVTQPGGRRAFCPPLADLGADTSVFEISEERATGGNPEVTLDVGLRIRVKAPAGGFQSADPLLRLNALGRAEVRFYPAGQQTVAGIGEIKRDSLVLYIAHWAQWFRTVAWWQNWVQADCLPATFVYENVDRAELQSLLQNAPLTDDAFPIFPRGITQANRAGFIASFLQGSRSVGARAGDYLGRAGPETAGAVEPGAARLLTFHAQYQGHLAPAARPMNPRELFHLLFGNDSQEAKTHPLLLRIDEVGRLAQEIDHDSMRMLLRPPLRTSKRVEWEAQREIDNHRADWRPGKSLTAANPPKYRLFNTHRRAGFDFDRGAYVEPNKCNLFVNDVCLRAGFCAAIHSTDTSWHYLDANSIANAIHQAAGGDARVTVPGRAEDAGAGWAWKVENWLRSQPMSGGLRGLLNSAINEQGRCFVLAGARPQLF